MRQKERKRERIGIEKEREVAKVEDLGLIKEKVTDVLETKTQIGLNLCMKRQQTNEFSIFEQ